MRYPVDNYKTEWDNHAGYDYGDTTAYGFHDGKDINDNGSGNSDLGKPLYAIAKGRVVGIHRHTSSGNFGNHFFLMITGEWGIRYVHYAHCLELFVQENQEVEEGYKVATVGNSGTVYAHCHFAIKKKASGMDDIANNRVHLDDVWEDPIAFIEKYMTNSAPIAQPVAQPVAQPITDESLLPDFETKQEKYIGINWGALKAKITAKDQVVEDASHFKEDFEQYKKDHPEVPQTIPVPVNPTFKSSLANLFYSWAKVLG